MSQNEPQRRRIDPSVMAALIGGFFTLMATIITLAVNNNNNNNAQAALLTVAPTQAIVQTATEIMPSNTPLPPNTATSSATTDPSATPLPPNTPVPTDVPVTIAPTNAPPTPVPTDIPAAAPTDVPGATAAPSGWLPVQFAYGSKGFFLVNASGAKFAARKISFAQIDGTSGYQGARWAQFGRDVFPGGCMRLNAQDEKAYATAPDACTQINATVVSNSQEMFWSQPFRVLWDGVEIAQCSGGEGTCDAFVPG